MRKSGKLVSRYRKVLKILEQQRKTLTYADSDREIVETYSAVLKHLAQLSQVEILELHTAAPKNRKVRRKTPEPSIEMDKLSLAEIEKLTTDESTPRKTLEEIATERFQVPRGSMRSFSNVQNLREKIITLVQNERAHQTISAIAQQKRT